MFRKQCFIPKPISVECNIGSFQNYMFCFVSLNVGVAFWLLAHFRITCSAHSAHIWPFGNMISTGNIHNAGYHTLMIVADKLNHSGWHWPESWKAQIQVLNSPAPILTNVDDRYSWVTNEGKDVNFSIKQAWQDLRVHWNKVYWHDHLWFKHGMPSFRDTPLVLCQHKILSC